MARALREGTWFAVPLEPGYAVGLLARARGGIGFGYFFGPLGQSVPDVVTLRDLRATAATFVSRFTLGAVRDGAWPLLGIAQDWTPSEWPIPLLCRFDELQDRYVLVRYGDDPVEPEGELLLPTGESPDRFPSDDCVGEGLMPAVLSHLLRGHS